MHYAINGQTAAEMIITRVNADKPFLGLTNFKGKYITAITGDRKQSKTKNRVLKVEQVEFRQD